MKPEELDDLILGYAERRLSAQDTRRLDDALRSDPASARRFAELALQEGLLRDLAETEELGAAADAKTSSTTRIRRVRAFRHRARPTSTTGWAWAAAAAGFMLMVGFVLAGRGDTRRPRDLATRPVEPEPPAPEIPDPDPPATRRVIVTPEVPPPLPLAPPPTPIAPPPAPKPPAPEPPPPPPRETVVSVVTVAKIERTEGTVEIVGPQGRIVARPGRPIAVGESIQTADRDSFATLKYDEGTRLDLDPGTLLTGFTAGPAKSVQLTQGSFSASVTKQPAGNAFVLSTPQGEARVLGTRLWLAADARETRLEVSEGRVRLTRRADGAGADVAAGHQAVLAAGVSPAPRPIGPLFSDTFDAAPLNDWPKGWLKHETEPASRSGWRVLQDPARPRERIIGCTAALGSLTQHALLPVDPWPTSFGVTFKMRLTGTRITRAGIEIGDGRLDPSFEYNAVDSSVRVDWPRGKALKQTPLKLSPGSWSEWTISADGGRFRIVVDRKPVLEAELPEFGRVRGASLVSRGSDSAQFDDIKVVRR